MIIRLNYGNVNRIRDLKENISYEKSKLVICCFRMFWWVCEWMFVVIIVCRVVGNFYEKFVILYKNYDKFKF